MNLEQYSTEDLIDSLPENCPLYKDSGLWQVRTDDMYNVYIQQHANESLRQFIIRYIEWLDESGYGEEVRINLSCKSPIAQ